MRPSTSARCRPTSRTPASSGTGARRRARCRSCRFRLRRTSSCGKPNYAVIATIREDGSPYTAATWYDWDGERILVNMDASRVRLRHLRRDPRVSLTVLDGESWYRHLTVFGRAVEIVADPDLADIDRLAQRYAGRPHGRSHARQCQRVDRAGRLVRLGGRRDLADERDLNGPVQPGAVLWSDQRNAGVTGMSRKTAFALCRARRARPVGQCPLVRPA